MPTTVSGPNCCGCPLDGTTHPDTVCHALPYVAETTQARWPYGTYEAKWRGHEDG